MTLEIPQTHPSGRLAGKIAVVIGAGCAAPGWGNGNATAALFAREGAKVFCVDRDAAAARATADLIEGAGGEAMACAADATSLADMQRAAAECIKAWGRIDVLQNNVGGSTPGGVAEVDEETWVRVLDLNLNTAYRACKAVLPYMIEQRSGAITNIASLVAVSYIEPISAPYAAAKAGVVQMTKTIAVQHALNGIRANSIIVGHVDTAEIRRRIVARFGAERLDEVLAARASVTRNGRNATPWDIAYAALYLASDEANYVSGSEITVDGAISTAFIESYMDRVTP